MFFKNKKLINWKEPNCIEVYRQNIEQNIIDNFLKLTFTTLDIDNSLKNKKIKIIDIETGYSKWLIKFIKIYKKDIYSFSILNLDVNDTLGHYLKNFKNIDNKVKDEMINLGLYCTLERDLKNVSDKSVHFVYQKNMITVFNYKEWDLFINEIFRILENNCKCEFVEYDFIIKNVENESISSKINKYIEKKIKNININTIIKKINKKFNKSNYKTIKMPLYKETIFDGICIENVILGYSHFMKDFIKTLNKKNIKLTNNEVTNILISEWEYQKSYIELYFIYAEKII